MSHQRLELERELEIARRQDDLPQVALLLWRLGQDDIRREDFTTALPRVLESYQLNQQLGQLSGVCAVGLVAGQLMAAGGQVERAREILAEVRDGFAKLGQPQGCAQAEKLLGLLRDSRQKR